MARPKKQSGAPGTQSGAGIIFRRTAIEGLGTSIQMLEDEAAYQRQMLNNLTQGGTIGRRGNAGGFQVGRGSTGPAGGTNAEGGVSNPVWIGQLLRQHTEGLTAAQIREYAVQAGRTVHQSFPHDSFGKMRAQKLVRKTGSGTNARYRLTQQGIERMARAGTANLPVTGRTKKGAGKAMAMTDG